MTTYNLRDGAARRDLLAQFLKIAFTKSGKKLAVKDISAVPITFSVGGTDIDVIEAFDEFSEALTGTITDMAEEKLNKTCQGLQQAINNAREEIVSAMDGRNHDPIDVVPIEINFTDEK